MRQQNSPFTLAWPILILIFSTLFIPNILFAGTYYVATSGSDSNPGTATSPFKTIKKGVAILSPGDTLYVKAGTYGEALFSWQTTIPNGESWSKSITVAAYPGDTVIINPVSGGAFFWIKEAKAKYLIIDGFIIDGQNQALHGFKFHGGATHIRVKNTEIKNATSSGVLVTVCNTCPNPYDTYHEFINLNVHHNGIDKTNHGFYIETSHNLVEDSRFHNNSGNGGKFYHGNLTEVSNHNIARNNNFYDNSTSGQWSCGLILSSGEGNVAYNNIAYGNFAGFCIMYRVTNAHLFNNISYENDSYGIYVGITSTDKSFVGNNTVYNNSGHGIFVGNDAKNTTVSNNISYLNKGGNISLQNQTGTIISNNLTTDPLFENANGKDFRLKQGSPAINKGEILNFITHDFIGTPRPQGSSYDIGAYEGLVEVDQTPPGTPQNVVIN